MSRDCDVGPIVSSSSPSALSLEMLEQERGGSPPQGCFRCEGLQKERDTLFAAIKKLRLEVEILSVQIQETSLDLQKTCQKLNDVSVALFYFAWEDHRNKGRKVEA